MSIKSRDLHYTNCYRRYSMSRLAVIKGVIYALIMGVVAIVGIMEQGNATYIVLAFLFGALLIFGVEINTVELGEWLKIDFTSEEDGED